MVAETAKEVEALEAQAQRILAAFIAAGYEAVSPAIIQPAGIFLDVIGETLRARTYVFTDPDGDELCLRPDLTVPTCRLHLERHPDAPATPSRYCYAGTAFRFQPAGADSAHPREFRQAGIENIAAPDGARAEADTVQALLDAVEAAGLRGYRLRIGDLGLLRGLLASLDMPDRWRRRLQHHFWRPQAFRTELQRLVTAPAQHLDNLPKSLIGTLDPDQPEQAERIVAHYLTSEGIDMVGVRSLSEATESLCSLVADARAEPLPRDTAAAIERYLAIDTGATEAPEQLRAILRDPATAFGRAVENYVRRLALLEEAGVDVRQAQFSAEFGRTLEYYTGFVFEIVAPALGEASPVAGGGRYDSLMRAIGSPVDLAAVGGAIHADRLLTAVNGRPR